MKLSWSHKLYFKINNIVGKYKYLDYSMLFCAHWLIYLLGVVVLVWAQVSMPPVEFKGFIKVLLTALVFSVTTSWLIGLIWENPRPIVEFPKIKQLFKPYKTWKSFPSDHTTISFVLVFVCWFSGASWWFGLVVLILGIVVAVARVFAGVHYPRDIVGGIILALLYSYLAFWLVINVTQPMYNTLINML